jgi:hypothetical protein
MKARKNLYLFLMVIFLTTLACWPSGNGTEAPPAGDDAVETSVAATLTAQGVGGSPATAPPSPGTQAPPTAPPPSVTQAPATAPPVLPPPPPPAVLRIAYNDGNNLRLWTDGVGVTTLYSGERVTDLLLSDDGQVVAFITQSPQWVFTGLWVARTDGSVVQRLVDAPTMNAFNTNPSALGATPYHLEFIPGTHTLAFNTRLVFEIGLILQDDLRLLDTDTGVLTTLLNVGQAGMFYYSLDGSQIALSTPTSISLINADGTNRRDNVLTYPAVITYSEYQWYSFPRWWPDSSQLSVVIPSEDPFAPGASMTVWNVPLDGSPPLFLGTYTTDMALFDADSLISPDMTRVAYLQRVGQPANNTWDLHLVELYGTSDTVFTTGDLRFESWSPNSGWFVYTENQDMKVAQFGNPGAWPLADVPPARDMKWVDDNRFIYISGSYGSWDLRMGSFSWPSIQIGTSTAAQVMLFDFSN